MAATAATFACAFVIGCVSQATTPDGGCLTVAAGNPGLATDPRFADAASRLANRDALIEIIEAALAKYPDAIAAAEDWGFTHHVPIAPVLTVEQACKHPHLVERETIRTVTDPVGTHSGAVLPSDAVTARD